MMRILILIAAITSIVLTATADRRGLFQASNAPAPVAYRSHETNIWSANNFTINKPAGTTTGDILVFYVVTDTAAAWTNASAWTLQETNSNAGASFLALTRVVDGSEGSTFNVNFDAVESGAAILVCYSGASAFDTDAVETGAPGSGVAHTTALITPSVNDSMLIGCIYIDPLDVVAFTEVSGYTLRASTGRAGNAALAIADKLQTTATSEGPQIIENVGGTWGEYTLSLKP